MFLVAEILGELGKDVADEVAENFRTGLIEHFGVEPAVFLLDEDLSDIAW